MIYVGCNLSCSNLNTACSLRTRSPQTSSVQVKPNIRIIPTGMGFPWCPAKPDTVSKTLLPGSGHIPRSHTATETTRRLPTHLTQPRPEDPDAQSAWVPARRRGVARGGELEHLQASLRRTARRLRQGHGDGSIGALDGTMASEWPMATPAQHAIRRLAALGSVRGSSSGRVRWCLDTLRLRVWAS